MKLKVNVEKTEMAKQLEEKLGISWDLVQQYSYDAGYDVRACIDLSISLAPGRQTLISTGLHVQMEDPHWEIQVRPRSGLAAKKVVTITNSPGTIDFGYREEIKVILLNLGRETFTIRPGERIAQLCFREIPEVDFNYVEKVERTERSGFGSSGST